MIATVFEPMLGGVYVKGTRDESDSAQAVADDGRSQVTSNMHSRFTECIRLLKNTGLMACIQLFRVSV